MRTMSKPMSDDEIVIGEYIRTKQEEISKITLKEINTSMELGDLTLVHAKIPSLCLIEPELEKLILNDCEFDELIIIGGTVKNLRLIRTTINKFVMVNVGTKLIDTDVAVLNNVEMHRCSVENRLSTNATTIENILAFGVYVNELNIYDTAITKQALVTECVINRTIKSNLIANGLVLTKNDINWR